MVELVTKFKHLAKIIPIVFRGAYKKYQLMSKNSADHIKKRSVIHVSQLDVQSKASHLFK